MDGLGYHRAGQSFYKTAYALVQKYGLIGVEDLNFNNTGMLGLRYTCP